MLGIRFWPNESELIIHSHSVNFRLPLDCGPLEFDTLNESELIALIRSLKLRLPLWVIRI